MVVPATSPPGSFFFTVTRVGTRYGCLLREQHGCMMTSGLCMRCLVIETINRILAQKSNEKDLEKKIQNKFVEGETSRKWSAGAGKRYKLANSVSFLFIFCFFCFFVYLLFSFLRAIARRELKRRELANRMHFFRPSCFRLFPFYFSDSETGSDCGTARATEAGAEANPHEELWKRRHAHPAPSAAIRDHGRRL